MSNGTLLTKHELLIKLADNSNKEISAADVQSIVKSNYQPVMIFSGMILNDSNLGSKYFVRTNYYNPDFFTPRSDGGGLENSSQVWRFTNRGAGLNANATYTNVSVNPSSWPGSVYALLQFPTAPAVFNITTNSSGQVDTFEIVSGGKGWIGPGGTKTGTNWQYAGQTGTLNISGAGITSPTVEFIGPITYSQTNQASDKLMYDLSTNSNSPGATVPGQGTDANHTFVNTMVNHSFLQGVGEQQYNLGAMVDPNIYAAQNLLYIDKGSNTYAIQLSLYRMP